MERLGKPLKLEGLETTRTARKPQLDSTSARVHLVMRLRARSLVVPVDLEIESRSIVRHCHSPPPSYLIMPTATKLLYQHLMEVDSGQLSAHIISECDLIKEQHQLRSLFERNEGRALGLAGGFALTGELAMLAIADASTIFIIEFELKKSKGNEHDERPVTPASDTDARVFLTQNLLRRTTGFLYAFDVAPIALALFQTLDLRIANAIDIQCAGSKTTTTPLSIIKQAVGDLHRVLDVNINKIFRDNTIINDRPAIKNGTTSLALRAWIAHYLSQLSIMEDRLAQVPPVDTFRLSDEALEFLAKSSKDSFQLEQKKPTEFTRKFPTSVDHRNNHIHAQADRYQNKIRKGQHQRAFIDISEHAAAGRGFTVDGQVTLSQGRTAKLATSNSLSFIGKIIGSIKIVGRDDRTQAETQRAQKVLEILQGLINLEHDNPWVQLIFFSSPSDDFRWPSAWTEEANDADIVRYRADRISRPLNPSQTKAVKQMLLQSNDGRLTVIQGPPGTGKTTVIASFVQTALRGGLSGIWLIAQSNVAVKNIAEKLADVGLTKWKLLVSREFFEYWHEHLYANIRANIIISDDFKAPTFFQELRNSPVILCTLSMLSSFALRKFGGFNAAPIRTLVIDEASQIEIGDYIPLFTSHTSIRKVCFIGDDKQLPPHGQDDIQDLKSVFEVKHVKDRAIFLNTQCKSFS
ncbi:uncharacterized protein EDB93DRAFT_1150045 [Suillus bovinus]|uniref:uncharacterized protein n=1 Tax=Suillus bovinus TaxID=48563 RepID=UPI001B86B021|nr:uncharacterized protein EDB93DRAFT_1150045 [Suillus bovinus]KAG2146163.1 hypothetical protein EDB93DRAFT_1150045 [Suillus bovinus]